MASTMRPQKTNTTYRIRTVCRNVLHGRRAHFIFMKIKKKKTLQTTMYGYMASWYEYTGHTPMHRDGKKVQFFSAIHTITN